MNVRDKRPLNRSLLDRLLDDNPGVSTEPPLPASQAARELRAAVRRDLEALLNCRRRAAEPPPALTALDTSLVDYGLPDFSGANMSSPDSRVELTRLIENTIRKYETRFKTVRVELLDNAEPLDRTLRFRIDGVLYAEPTPEPIVFDSTLEPATGSVQIKGEN